MISKSKNTDVANNRHQRRVIRDDITVAFQTKDGKRSISYFVELLNISLQGMAFRCDKSLRVSTPLNLILSFNNDRIFFIKGSVTHKILETGTGKSGVKRVFINMFESDSILFKYGIKFEKVNADFQTTFIANKLQHMDHVKGQFQVGALVKPLAS